MSNGAAIASLGDVGGDDIDFVAQASRLMLKLTVVDQVVCELSPLLGFATPYANNSTQSPCRRLQSRQCLTCSWAC